MVKKHGRSARGRSLRLAAALAIALGLGSSCTPRLAPLPGHAPWRALAAFGVRDGWVDLAGGNLLLRRTDLTIETRLGTQAVTHTYNSASDRWTWSFDMTYAGGVFTDDTGARHALGALSPGPIEGTRWRKADGAAIESRGGLRFSFAPDGRLARVAWRHASYPSLELSRAGDGTLRIAQCTAAAACADVFVVRYAGADVATIVDRAGRQVAYGWAGGRLAWVETPFDRENALPARRYSYALGASGRPTAVVVANPEQEQARYELDEAGRVTGYVLVGEESPRWTFQHLAAPLRTIAADPLGRQTELRFDASRRLVEVQRHALGERTTLGWTGLRVTRVTAPDGLVTTARYAADEPVEWRFPSGRMLAIDYAPGAVNLADPFAMLPARVRDAGALVVERAFDAQGRLVSETNGAGERTAFHYGPLETLIRVDLPSGQSLRLAEYGEHGQPVEVRVPAPDPDDPDFVERRVFDAVGDMTRGAEPGSESGSQFPGVVARRFDAARQLGALVMSQDLQGAAQDIVFARRSDGRLRAIQRPYGASAEYDYDALGRLRAQRERVDGAWAVTRFAWTPLGELARAERPNGMAQELGYDAAGRPVRRTNLRGGAFEAEVRYAYAAGRLVRKDDSTAPGPTRFGYDAAGRLRDVSWPDREQSWLLYDGRDRPMTSTLIRADGTLLRQLGLRYDAAGREAQLLDGGAVVYEQVYAAGRLAAIRHGNGVVRTLSYDAFGRPAGAVSRDAAGRELETETVRREGYDFAGPDPNGPFRVTFAGYRATAAFGPLAFAERASGYRYADGSRWFAGFFADSGTVEWCNGPECTEPEQSAWLRYGGLMDLESESLPAASTQGRPERRFVRNPERNRLHEVVLRTPTPAGPVEQVEHRYTWDAAGFATSRDGVPIVWDASGQLARFGAARFERDAEGRLRAATVAGVITRRRFGGLVEADANGQALRIDLGGVAIDLVANRKTYRHFDWRGNVRSLWDESGAILGVREYGGYGRDRSHGDAGDPRGFAQGLEIAGLVVLGERVYDPDARQFLSPDPVYSVFHQHVYGAGDPANYWDWTGRSAEATVGYQVAGAIGEGFGMAGGFVIGLALGARSGNGLAVMAFAGTFAAQGGRASRGFVELLYSGLYDFFTAPADPTSSGTHGGSAPLGPLQIPPAISGPSQPEAVCNGECFIDWDGNRGDGYPGGRGSGSIQPFYFAPAMPAPACGLTGFEPLALLALAARRRRVAGTRRSR